MKKLPLLTATLFLTALISIHAEPALELDNPGFERGLRGWVNKVDNDMSQATAEARHEGDMGLRVTDDRPDAGSSLYSSKFAVSSGKVYQLRFWARAISGEGAGVYIVFYNAQGKTFMETKEEELKNHLDPVTIPATQSEWKEFLMRKTAPAGAVEARVWIHSYTTNKSITDFDEFRLAELD